MQARWALAAGAVVFAASVTAQAQSRTFQLNMLGANEPNSAGQLGFGDPDGFATGTITLDPVADTVSWNFTYGNITGDAYKMDADGYFWFQARNDDMIISSGYNIAGPEVENAIMEHPSVLECACVAAPDEERGHVVKAFIVLRDGFPPGDDTAKALQEFVKQQIAPYKYPRRVEFVASLPRTATGKLQRFRLRDPAS